ncbi:MAG: TonB-dependent receptor, partial [Ferruginibacter sp.]
KPQQKQNAYIAGELYITDGPFDAAQQFKRYNLFAKHQYHFAASTLTTQVSTFWSRWYASGQVPVRAIEDGAIDWFGAIDPNEGGQTSRTNVSFKLNTRLHNGGVVENQLFYTKYNFELYSNFTFFKEDPINGDEIRQKENRNILGFNSTYSKDKYLNAGKSWQFKGGFNIRHDINEGLELSRTLRRTTVTQPLAYGDVVETSISGFLSETYRSKKWTLNAALRYDQFNFQYEDQLNRLPNKSVNKGIFCPKFNVQYQATSQTALYVKAGRGFHSNDARVVIPQNGAKVLPGAWGADIGFIAKPVPKLMLNAAIWVLDLAQEFVYVGDEAVVEPGSRTFRKGIDLSLRYELTKHLLVDIDANYTIGRAIEEPKGMQYLPLAPKFSSTGGLAYTGTKINAGLRYRWLGNRAANEDNSILAKGYCILDANFTYRINKKYSLGFVAENLLNTKWKETQFLTESRLQNEIVPVEEIHFTPGTPFFIKARFTVEF